MAISDFTTAAATAFRRRAPIGAVLLAALATPGCNDSKSADKKAGPAPAPVTVSSVERATVPVTITAIGNVEPIQTVAIKSRIDGEIVAVHVRDGEDVSKGQLLLELDDRYLQAQLKQLEAAEARDRALLANAQSLEQRYQDLLAKGFISQEAYTQAKTTRDAAAATVAADHAAVETARVQLSYTTAALAHHRTDRQGDPAGGQQRQGQRHRRARSRSTRLHPSRWASPFPTAI